MFDWLRGSDRPNNYNSSVARSKEEGVFPSGAFNLRLAVFAKFLLIYGHFFCPKALHCYWWEGEIEMCCFFFGVLMLQVEIISDSYYDYDGYKQVELD